ncbi:MAG TPA: HypC/HybG/HupF family hydrogenase formation chaperone [Burkholderiaceae bacterium]
MCWAIPSRVISTEGDTACVECFDVRREVSLTLLPEPVAVGDFVLVRAGRFAVEKIGAGHAQEVLDLFERVLAAAPEAAG